nr:cytoplasmic protein [Cryptococcus depauperatus CBS 7855]
MVAHYNHSEADGIPHSAPTGRWQPLPYIHSGFIIYPFHPETSPPSTPTTTKEALSRIPAVSSHDDLGILPWSNGRPNMEDATMGSEGRRNPYEIPLDVGDEFYAFEEYRCTVEEDGRGDLWYRGFVVQAVPITSLAPAPSSQNSNIYPASFPRPEPSVLTGIFPAAVCYIRPGDVNDNGELSEAYERAVRAAEERYRKLHETIHGAGLPWFGEMDTVEEEDEGETDVISPNTPHNTSTRGVVEVGVLEGRTVDGLVRRRSSRGSISKFNISKSMIHEAQEKDPEEDKEEPPLPKLTAGDSTLAGQQWPLVDEIACAIREWYGKLPTYLANREYRLFATVVQHIDALFLGRRQLLSQMLSADELVRIRRECVSRLVKCNVAQGLDVIVRSLEDGSVVVVDRERAFTGTRWVGGISCYVHQVQLAYIDLIPLDKVFGKMSSHLDPYQYPSSLPFSLAVVNNSIQDNQSTGSHYHLLLDVRAFVANPSAPGETAELYFSLYHKNEAKFITEEYCLILNHFGSPARDAEQRIGRLRTLFADIKKEDFSQDTYLVCKIVRNGAMKMRLDSGVQPTADISKRNSLYGLSEAGNTLKNQFQAASSMNLTDDSFSVTSGFGPEIHRAGITVDTLNDSTTNPSPRTKPRFRRPLGVAVLLLPAMSNLMGDGLDKPNGGVEKSVPIYVPRDEASFSSLHEDVIHNRVKQFTTSPRAESVALSLKTFQGSVPQLVQEHPTLLLDIPITSRLAFSDVILPEQSRNDLYINLVSASFIPITPTTGSMVRKTVLGAHYGEVQISMEVRRMDGTVVPDGIFAGGSGEPAMERWNSMVFYHNEKPVYNEMIRVSLPTHPVDYHLFLTFRSRIKDKHADPSELEKPFAFAYLPLLSPAASIKDGEYELVLYRMEKNYQPLPNIYFDAPFVTKDPDPVLPSSVAKSMAPLKDRVLIRTLLCSTLQTQDSTLQSLFGWQSSAVEGDLEGLREMLRLFGFVSEDEISHFVPKVLDSLFGIMVSNLGEKQDQVDDLIFKSLIKVLAMMSDRRFPNFKQVFDIYIDKIFNFPASSSRLLRSMKSIMSNPNHQDYRSFLKVWHLFFKFMIRSREQNRAKGIGLDATFAHLEADFQKQTRHILEEINKLMQSSDKSLIGTQTLAVQHYADILPDLAHVFKSLEIAEMVIAFADTLSYVKGSIAIYKLLLLLQVIKNVFETSESRSLLVPAIVRWIKPHLGSYDEWSGGIDSIQSLKDGKKIKWLECNRLAVTVLAWMINKLQEWHVSPFVQDDDDLKRQEEENIEYCLTLLPALYASYAEISSPKASEVLHRQQSSATSTIWKPTPDIFPTVHPFALISQLPSPSLLERHQHADEDGLPKSGLFNCSLAECAVVIITLIIATPNKNITTWLIETLEIGGTESCGEVFDQTFQFSKSVIRFEAFPKQWLTLRSMCFSGILKLLECIGNIMEGPDFIPPPSAVADINGKVNQKINFDVKLWQGLFELLCELCGSEELALEDQTQQRRRADWIVAGDLRDTGARLLKKMWHAIGWSLDIPGGQTFRLGGYQTKFTNLAEKIIGLCLSSHDGLCETAVDILFSLMYAEFLLDRKQVNIETQIFMTLNRLFTSRTTSSSSDPTMRAYFVAQLRDVFESTPEVNPLFTTKIMSFLSQIEHFIDLLLELREVPSQPLWKDEQSAAIYKLMSFVNHASRRDLYLQYVHKLVEINKEAGDWLGAGLALKLHADVHEWKLGGENWVEAGKWGEIEFSGQSEFARKQMIYYHVLEFLAQAEAYEFSIDICQELTAQHQMLTYDITVLSDLLIHQAKLWKQISKTWRSKPEYFRVAYLGEIPSLDKGKDYIVRAPAGQKYNDFCEALQTKYQQATIHRSKIQPPESIRASNDPVIWVMPVVPEPELSKPVFGENVSENVQNYWKWNGIRCFSSLRPYLKDPGEREAALTWTEKTILFTKAELPGVLNRSEIISVKYEQISPVTMAVMEVEKATKSLKKSCRGRNGQMPESKVLGTAINSAVDSPTSEGIKTYRKARSYLDNHLQDRGQIEQLRRAISDYIHVIQESLEVHKQVCKDIAFHEVLRNYFYKAFPEETAQLPRLLSSADDLISLSNNRDENQKSQKHTRSNPSVTINSHRSSGGKDSPIDNRRLSTISAMSSNDSTKYNFHQFSIGSGYTEDGEHGSLGTETPRGSISTTRHTPSSTIHTVFSPTGSPVRSNSKSGSIRKKEHRQSLNSPLGGGFMNGSVASLGSKAKSMIGLGSKFNVSMAHENGEIEEKPSLPLKERGLRRFGSLIRGK